MRRRNFLKTLAIGFAGAVAGGLGYFAPSEPWGALRAPALDTSEGFLVPELQQRIVDAAQAFARLEDEIFFEAVRH